MLLENKKVSNKQRILDTDGRIRREMHACINTRWFSPLFFIYNSLLNKISFKRVSEFISLQDFKNSKNRGLIAWIVKLF